LAALRSSACAGGVLPRADAKFQGTETRYDTVTVGTDSFGQKGTDQRFLVGARLYAGQGTLQSNDRTGASLDIIDPLGTASSPVMFGVDQFVVSDVRLKRDIAPVGQLKSSS
jgi:hypothetical protein